MVEEGEADGAEDRCCSGPGAGASSQSICVRGGLHSGSCAAASQHSSY